MPVNLSIKNAPANICLKKMRRYPAQRAELETAFQLRGHIPVDEIVVDCNGILKLAADTGLTAYDASYLWLAQQLGAELVTLDRHLARAAAIE